MRIIKNIYDLLGSLNLGLWLIGGVMALLATGSFVKPAGINDMALFQWLSVTAVADSWWLWGTIGLLAVLALNTVVCSIESIRGKYRSTRLINLIAPHAMHAGFLLMVFAHLLSAQGGVKQVMALREGAVIGLRDGARLQLATVSASMGPMGFPTDYSAVLRVLDGTGETMRTISPNHPYFLNGNGFYLKEVALQPYPAALIEIHREPGAGCALAGALLFTVGNVLLLIVRRGRRE